MAGIRKLRSPRRSPGNTPVVILLTDGIHTGRPGAETDAAEVVRAAGIVLYTIGLGDDADKMTLELMAGDRRRYFFAPDSSHLRRIYTEVAHDIDCPAEDFWGRR